MKSIDTFGFVVFICCITALAITGCLSTRTPRTETFAEMNLVQELNSALARGDKVRALPRDGPTWFWSDRRARYEMLSDWFWIEKGEDYNFRRFHYEIVR